MDLGGNRPQMSMDLMAEYILLLLPPPPATNLFGYIRVHLEEVLSLKADMKKDFKYESGSGT